MANRYNVFVRLEGSYTVVAEDEESAFVLASDYAMDGGDWDYDVDLIEENVDEDEG